jgi:hypothetical protein
VLTLFLDALFVPAVPLAAKVDWDALSRPVPARRSASTPAP